MKLNKKETINAFIGFILGACFTIGLVLISLPNLKETKITEQRISEIEQRIDQLENQNQFQLGTCCYSINLAKNGPEIKYDTKPLKKVVRDIMDYIGLEYAKTEAVESKTYLKYVRTEK
jgi:hypothetical protein